MSTESFRLRYLAKTAAGVPRDLVNSVIASAFHPIRPTVLIYNCTFVCDARCEMCHNWKHGDRKSDMTLEQLDRVMDHPFWGAVENLNISGGEPTTRNDLPEMVELFAPAASPPAKDRHQHDGVDAPPRHPAVDAHRGVLRAEAAALQRARVARRHRRHSQPGAPRRARLRQGLPDDRGDAGALRQARELSVRHRRDDLRDQPGRLAEYPGVGANQEPRHRLQHAAVHRRDVEQQGARGEDRLQEARRRLHARILPRTACRKSRC